MTQRARSAAPLRAAALLAAALLAAGGCKGKPADDQASVKTSLEKKGTLQVLSEMAQAKYDPPADGKLTEQQIAMYVAVKQRALRIRALAEGLDDATADLRAALEQGGNPKEYQWVAERVMEALLSELSQRLAAQLAEGREQYVQMLEVQKQAATDTAQRAAIDKQIAAARAEQAQRGQAPASEALRHNLALVAKHRDEIKAVLSPEERFATGLSEAEQPAEPPAEPSAAPAPPQP
jgi:hypothetical protein